uniref:Ig-like domain-containing protein n=1 Tax=Theropithecus gelada TaxID=9565 RepID=A0A8D2K6E5_THEGE
MGSPSAPLHRRCIPWQKLLLTASLLTFWNPPTTAQLTIESRPFNVAEGKEVLLLAHNLSHNLFGYIWYKGERVDASRRIGSHVIGTQQITLGPAHSGRETIDFNASLLIQNVTQNDTGSYTLQVIKEDLVNEEATGQFRVYREPGLCLCPLCITCRVRVWTFSAGHTQKRQTSTDQNSFLASRSCRHSLAISSVIYTVELPKPYITSNNSSPIEDKDAVTLTCEPVAENTTYLWWVNNQSLSVSPRLELSNGNRTLTLLSVTRNDTGPYECGIQNSETAKRSDPVTLNVTYGPDTPIISPPDLSYRSGANLNLSCHSDSNPSPQYSWLINGTLRQHTQVLFISKITSNNNGAYACFVSNLATGRNNSIIKNISVSSGKWLLWSTSIIGTLVGIALNLQLTVGIIVLLTILSFPIYEKRNVFPFIDVVFNFFQQCFIVFRVQSFHLLG